MKALAKEGLISSGSLCSPSHLPTGRPLSTGGHPAEAPECRAAHVTQQQGSCLLPHPRGLPQVGWERGGPGLPPPHRAWLEGLSQLWAPAAGRRQHQLLITTKDVPWGRGRLHQLGGEAETEAGARSGARQHGEPQAAPGGQGSGKNVVSSFCCLILGKSQLPLSVSHLGNVRAGPRDLQGPSWLRQVLGVRFSKAKMAPMSSIENQDSVRVQPHSRRCRVVGVQDGTKVSGPSTQPILPEHLLCAKHCRKCPFNSYRNPSC